MMESSGRRGTRRQAKRETSAILSVTVSPGWIALTIFAGLNLLQSSITRFCPAGAGRAYARCAASTRVLRQCGLSAFAHNPSVGEARKAAGIARAGISLARAEGLPSVGLCAEGASVRDQFCPGYKADSGAGGCRSGRCFGRRTAAGGSSSAQGIVQSSGPLCSVI